jgi:hydrogenase expression/formation protein HypC
MCLGIPAQIVEITDPGKKMAKVAVAGIKREVNIACIVNPEESLESCVGLWVLVHVGFAMARIDEEEAQRTLALLTELGEAQQEIEAMERANLV